MHMSRTVPFPPFPRPSVIQYLPIMYSRTVIQYLPMYSHTVIQYLPMYNRPSLIRHLLQRHFLLDKQGCWIIKSCPPTRPTCYHTCLCSTSKCKDFLCQSKYFVECMSLTCTWEYPMHWHRIFPSVCYMCCVCYKLTMLPDGMRCTTAGLENRNMYSLSDLLQKITPGGGIQVPD